MRHIPNEKNHYESIQSIHQIEYVEEVLTDEIEATDDFKSDKVEFDGNNTVTYNSCRPRVVPLLKCTWQLDPVIFVTIFIVCGVRALPSYMLSYTSEWNSQYLNIG